MPSDIIAAMHCIRCLAVMTLLMNVISASFAADVYRQPNVVFFLADDLGWRDFGYTGSTFYETPNIDALAARGCVFTNAHSACPVCSPSRAALMTGRYPARVGITDYIGGPQPKVAATQPRFKNRALLPAPYRTELPLEEITVGEAFKEAGYSTFYAGKWHLGRTGRLPDSQGFDTSFGSAGGVTQSGYFAPYGPALGIADAPAGEHIDLRLAHETANWIAKQSGDKAMLAWFSLYDPHVPLMAPPETVKYFEAKRERLGLKDEFAPEGKSQVRLTQSHAVYAAMVKTMDDAVGIVVKQLEKQNLLDNTVIIFTSDNGGLSTAEGAPTSNLPLRAGKGWAYQGGVRVPLIVIAPGITKPGLKCETQTTSTDLFPTLLAACGLAARPKDHIDGIDLTPALSGKPLPDRPLFWHYPHYGNQGGQPFSAIRKGDWKLIAFHDASQGIELYDLAADPGEKNNLAKQHLAKAAELHADLDAWKASVKAIDAKRATPVKP
jgi:arylsulfatase A-like enzyme